MIPIPVIDGLFKVGSQIIDRLWPDPEKKAEAVLKLETMRENGELARLASETELAKAQIAVNLEEAKSTNPFIAGWRPAVGWVCVAVLAMTYIPKALVLTVFWSYQAWASISQPDATIPPLPDFPDLGITDLLGILGTLLGSTYIARLRTDEKIKGAEANR